MRFGFHNDGFFLHTSFSLAERKGANQGEHPDMSSSMTTDAAVTNNLSNEKTDSGTSSSKNRQKDNRSKRLKVAVPLPPPPPAPTKEILDDFYRARHLAFLRYQQNMLCVQEIISGRLKV